MWRLRMGPATSNIINNNMLGVEGSWLWGYVVATRKYKSKVTKDVLPEKLSSLSWSESGVFWQDGQKQVSCLRDGYSNKLQQQYNTIMKNIVK